MLSFTVHIYNYALGTTRTLKIAGYTYYNQDWYNMSVYQSGGELIGNINVRFGVEGGRNCVWIGETNTYWSYPNIFVTDVQCGHSQTANLTSGWTISLVTTLGTVQNTIVAYTNITTKDIGGTTNYVSKFTGANTLGNSLIFDNGTNVGIGTASPGYKLDIQGIVSVGTTAVGGTLRLEGKGGFSYPAQISTTTVSGIKFSDDSLGMNVVFLSSGNVGIGTTSPSYKLDVEASSGLIETIRIRNGYTGGSDGSQLLLGNSANFTNAYFRLNGGGNSSQAGAGSLNIGLTESSPMAFYTTNTERMRITSAGNVVINSVTTPYVDDKLYIASGNIILDNNRGYLQYTTGGARATLLALNSSNNLSVGQSNANNASLLLYGGTGNVTVNAGAIEVARFTTAGNVGIGTSSPSELLEVVGNIRANISNGGGFMLTGASASGLVRAGATGLALRTNTTDRLTVDNSGNVGIGTTSPSYKLDVQGSSGNTTINTNGYLSAGGQIISGLGEFVSSSSGTDVNFRAGATHLMILKTSGNVGIGTTSPSIIGTGIISLDIQGSSAGGLAFGPSGIKNYIYGASTMYIEANTTASFSTSGTEKMRITSGGNVGIGTSSPNNKLDIRDGNIELSDSTYSNIPEIRFTANSGGRYVYAGIKADEDNSYNGHLEFWTTPTSANHTAANATFAERMRITAAGNVGIGNTSPSTLLDVSGVITATGGNSTNWNTAYGWGNHASASYVPQARTLTINGTSYDLSANRTWTIATTTAAGSDTQVQYNSSGSLAGASALTYNSTTNRVGINQASPGYDLDVNGQVRVQDKLRVGTGNGVVHMSSTATINASATTVVWAQTVSVGMCAFIEYYILNSTSLTDQRAGTIMVTWNQSGTPTITHTETTTPDIGSTTTVNFTSSLVGSDARINAVNSSANPYTMVMSYKYF